VPQFWIGPLHAVRRAVLRSSGSYRDETSIVPASGESRENALRPAQLPLDLGVEIEERFQACTQLLFDLFLAAFEHVHGDVGLPAILEFDRSLTYLGHNLGGQQPHAINQRQICHGMILRR
jgi:hypothetical protein